MPPQQVGLAALGGCARGDILRMDAVLSGDDVVPERFNMARYCCGAAAHRAPDAVALTVVHDAQAPKRGCQEWTFAQVDAGVRAVAAGLLARGIEPGQRVILRMGNTSSYAFAFFGALAAGIVAVPTSALLTPDEAQFVCVDSGAVAAVMSADLVLDLACPVISDADIHAWVQAAHDCAEPTTDAHPQAAIGGQYADTRADDPAFLVYTSGTTGVPKGVLHAHRSAWGRRPMYRGWYGITAHDRMLHAGAFNWTYTLGVGLTDPWAVGASAVIYNGPRDASVWARIVEDTGATLFAAVPGIYRQWLAETSWCATQLASLRHGLSAGEALAPSLREQWRLRTGLDIHQALGMSEISTFISSSPLRPAPASSIGRPQPGRHVGLLRQPHEHGERGEPTEVEAGEVGLIAVRCDDPGLMLGYWQRPDHEQNRWGQWFVTGDVAHSDEAGWLYHHGRADDLMNAGGYRVSPLEVEHCLQRHPIVHDVAVTERVVKEGVSIIVAYVVPESPAEADHRGAHVILEYASKHLAKYKCPREIMWVSALPRTANGKVMRRHL